MKIESTIETFNEKSQITIPESVGSVIIVKKSSIVEQPIVTRSISALIDAFRKSVKNKDDENDHH